jgi:WD40 repeat protein
MKEQKEAASKLRRRAFVTAGAAVVALLLFIIAMFMWHRSESAALRAEEQARIAVVARTSAEMTPASADRDILFACQLAKDLKRRATSEGVFGILESELERRGRLCQTYWNYERSGSNNDVGKLIPVRAVAYSPDGRTLVLGDSRARLRILRDGSLSEPISVNSGNVRALTFSPDGTHLAICTESGFVSVLDVGDPSPKSQIVELAFPDIPSRIPDVWSCSWNGKGGLAAACQNGKIYVWPDLLDSLKSGDRRPSKIIENNRLGKGDVPVDTVAWVGSSAILALGDAAGQLRLWDGLTLSDPTPASTNAIWSLASSSDGRLACASWDRSISVWTVEMLNQRATLVRLNSKPEAHEGWVRDVAWIDDDQEIASVGDDGKLKLWKSSDLTIVGAEQSPTTDSWSLCYSASTKMIATANYDGAVRIYRLALPQPFTYGDHGNEVICLAFMDTSLLSFDLAGGVDIFEPSSRKEKRTQVPRDLRSGIDFQSGIKSVRFQPLIKAFVIGYDLSKEHRQFQGRLATWYPTGLEKLRTANVEDAIALVACHPTEPIVAFLTSKGTLGLRTLPELEPMSDQPDFSIPLKPETESVSDMEWSNAGSILSVALNRNLEKTSELLRFNFDRRKLDPVDPRNPVKLQTLVASLAWHPSDQLVAFGTEGGAVILHSFSGWQTKPIGGHTGAVAALHWSVNGRQLFAGGQETNLEVWVYDEDRTEKLALLTTLHDKDYIRAIITCPDGTAIYTAGAGPEIVYWPVSSYSIESILARARLMVNRNMFASEWLGYNPATNWRHYEKVFENLPACAESNLR